MLEATGIGSAQIKFDEAIITLNDALLVPSLTSNLIILKSFISPDYSVTGDSPLRFKVLDENGNRILTGSYSTGNFAVDHNDHSIFDFSVSFNEKIVLRQSVGYPSLNHMKRIFPHQTINTFTCLMCDLSKAHKAPFTGRFPKASQKLE